MRALSNTALTLYTAHGAEYVLTVNDTRCAAASAGLRIDPTHCFAARATNGWRRSRRRSDTPKRRRTRACVRRRAALPPPACKSAPAGRSRKAKGGRLILPLVSAHVALAGGGWFCAAARCCGTRARPTREKRRLVRRVGGERERTERLRSCAARCRWPAAKSSRRRATASRSSRRSARRLSLARRRPPTPTRGSKRSRRGRRRRRRRSAPSPPPLRALAAQRARVAQASVGSLSREQELALVVSRVKTKQTRISLRVLRARWHADALATCSVTAPSLCRCLDWRRRCRLCATKSTRHSTCSIWCWRATIPVRTAAHVPRASRTADAPRRQPKQFARRW